MKLGFSDALFKQVIENCLVSAGELGKRALSQVDWAAAEYDALDVPNVDLSRASRFDKHVVPHSGGAGTFETPSNVDSLAHWLQKRGLSLMTRDFALRQPHQYARKDRSIVSSGEVYYYFESSSDDEHDLRRVITLAQSWTFLGMAANVLPVASLREERTADCISKIKTFVFSIFSGDTFLVVDLPLTGKPGSESN